MKNFDDFDLFETCEEYYNNEEIFKSYWKPDVAAKGITDDTEINDFLDTDTAIF